MLFEDLAAALGPAHVTDDPARLAPLLVDNRGRWHGAVRCACFPGTVAEAAQVMRICRDRGARVFPQGGNTGNVAGATPVNDPGEARGAVLVSLARLRAVEAIDAVNGTALVQAGAVIEDIQRAAAERGLMFGVSLASQGSCTAGGLVAANAGGVHVVRLGNAREQVLGLEVVLADGRVLDMLRGLRKDNAGYDLKQLFIGSEGTLGLITRVLFKLHPAPAGRGVAALALGRLADAEPAFCALQRRLGAGLAAFEVMHASTVAKVREVMPSLPCGYPLAGADGWLALVEAVHFAAGPGGAAGPALEPALEELLAAGLIADAAIAESEAQCRALWAVREAIPSAFKRAGGNVKHDVSVPRSRLAAFVEKTNADLKQSFAWCAPSVFGHFGDGNLHYNVGVCAGRPNALCFEHEEAIHAIVYRNVLALGGSIAAEHGVGRMKAALLPSARSAAEVAVMRAVKRTLDPDNRMNPGAVLIP
ncbi:MAG: FAD-binding oxidoreductase [Duodenibacillus sp.]|nr:FAD-binding oxidoreductase [Duodenibacillus sp.]